MKALSFVAKKLGFQECMRYGTAVDGDERLARPGALVVNSLSYQSLSCATLSYYQYGALAFGYSGDQLEDMMHLGAFAQNVLKGMPCVKLLAKLLEQAQVTDGLNPTDELTLFVTQNGGRDANGKLDPFPIGDLDRHAGDGFSGLHGVTQSTSLFADVATEYLMARLAESFLPGNPGDLGRCFVEEADPPVLVDAKYTIVETAEDSFEPSLWWFYC